MESSNMKNIVVLKNLPSNLVEEAIIILKSNKVAKRLEYIDKNSTVNENNIKKSKEYIVRDAEAIISSYISKIEKKQNERIINSNIEKNYKKLKIYSIIASIMLILMIVL